MRGNLALAAFAQESGEPRRRFLKQLAVGSAAAWMAGEPRLLTGAEGDAVEHPEPTADSCILIWMAGGMAAREGLERGDPISVYLEEPTGS